MERGKTVLDQRKRQDLKVESKDIFILGGPNGAGKTTAASVLLPEKLRLNAFLNADEIARIISPDNVEAVAFEAGRLMIERMRDMVRDGQSFAFETTCSGKSYIRLLKECQNAGWRISLIYLWVPSPEYSIARVARRVSQGGHHIPDEVIRRRYQTGLWNMRHLYLPLADDATIYDNRDRAMRLIARSVRGFPLSVLDEETWAKIEEETP
jgi:predicted ABC-type ATPase